MRVTAKVKQSTEKAIRTSARRLFVKHGFDATSTRQIAEAAKVAVGTLFNYFASKEALAVAIAAEAFANGRIEAAERLAAQDDGRARSVEEDLFSLIACDLRALAPMRSFVGQTLDVGLSPFATNALSPEAATIRATRLEDAAATLAAHGLLDAATPAVMHLYWSFYLGVIAFWSSDPSPGQEDTWALLDQGVRMFAGGLKRAADGAVRADADSNDTPEMNPCPP